jgi:putative ABC transport system ATP-binding protein
MATTEGATTTAPPSAPVAARGLTRRYGEGSTAVDALRGVDLEVRSGELVAVMGPSGSGKSTLMHILGCLDVPTSGIFRIVGHDAQSLDEDMLARIRSLLIGFVFQQFNLLAHMTALQNVELPLVYAAVDPDERRTRALAALDRVSLADRAQHRPGELSGGQQQRVAVARALVTEPAMLLADEPTGNLDSHAAADVLALLEELNEDGRTLVLITHERDVASRAHRMIEIRDGEAVEPEDLDSGVVNIGGRR